MLSNFSEYITINIYNFIIYSLSYALIYIVALSIVSIITYKLFKPSSRRRVAKEPVKSSQIKAETFYTMRSMFVQSMIHFILMFFLFKNIIINKDVTFLYNVATFLGLVLFHDTFFYWSHRLMHTKYFFQKVHKIHHEAKTTTTFSAYRYTVFEAFLQFIFFYIYIFFIPISVEVFFTFVIFSMTINIIGHSNIEIFPRWWLKLKIISTPTFHSMHHEKGVENYGIYFTFWDKIMGTKDRNYEARFLKTKEDKDAK